MANELDLMFAGIYKLLEDKLEENPKAGIKTKKGKIKYKEVQELMKRMETHFRFKGAFSFGICGTCHKFDTSSYQSPRRILASCGNKAVSFFDSCERWEKSDV